MKKTLIYSFILIFIGVIYTGNVINLWNISLFFRGWWTLIIIIPSLIGYLDKKYYESTIWLIFGLLLFLAANNYVSYVVVFPVSLIIIGVSRIYNLKLK